MKKLLKSASIKSFSDDGDSDCTTFRCMFQIMIYSLDDFNIKPNPSDPNYLMADSLIQLLQSKYSVSWKLDKTKGSSGMQTIKSQLLDSLEEYDFIDSYNNSGGVILTTSTPKLNDSTNRNRNRKSMALRHSIMKTGQRLVYSCEWNASFDMVVDFALGNPSHREKLLKIDIIEHKGSDQNVVATATVNLVEFTTPPPIFSTNSSTLTRTVIIPLQVQHSKTAKLKMNISSLWLKTQEQLYVINTHRNRVDPYFILDEKEESVSQTPILHHHSSFNAIPTPRSIRKQLSIAGNNDAPTTANSGIQSPSSPKTDAKLAEYIRQKCSDVSKSISVVKDTVESCESKINQLFKRLETIESEKHGHIRMCSTVTSLCNLNCIVFCDSTDMGQLWSIPDQDAVDCLNVYYDTLKLCINECFGVELNSQNGQLESSSDTILCGFENLQNAIKFSQMVHLRLLSANWPESLLESPDNCLFDQDNDNTQYIFRGLRARIAVDVVQESKFEAVRRATIIARYAAGGHTLVSKEAFNRLEPEIINSMYVQDLPEIEMEGLSEKECPKLVLPVKLCFRKYAFVENAQESSLVDDLYKKLDSIQSTIDESIRTKMRDLDHEFFKMNSLVDLYNAQQVGDSEKHQAEEVKKNILSLQTGLEVMRKESIGEMQKKIQSFEVEILKLDMSLLSANSIKKKRNGALSPRGLDSPRNSPRGAVSPPTTSKFKGFPEVPPLKTGSALNASKDYNAYMELKIEELKKTQQLMQERLIKTRVIEK
ncbi:adenylate cyclase [Acrasis kona]|uniref:Adenylate cyclase n=1 Tax=Acrasis kona TaxID=1008807 RepID=A0AAW2ZPL9_9EUKA